MPYKNPDHQRAYKRDWARMRRSGDCGTPSRTHLPSSFRLTTAQDVLQNLQEQIDVVLNDGALGTIERARTIGYLAGVTLKAVEASNLSSRLEALEDSLKKEKVHGKKAS